MNLKNNLVIGIDFGTDFVRAVLIDTSGNEKRASVSAYKRWNNGLYRDPAQHKFRQHPLDYLESMEAVLQDVLSEISAEERNQIKGISVDTTGSTPVAVNEKGVPLALCEGFKKNSNAMFVLWKDHSSIQEASEINHLARKWNGPDYTKYVGGVYSSEWFWAKILNISRTDPKVRKAAYSWAEHCDWITFELTGGSDITQMKRSRCAAGHKAMWHQEFEGLPSESFLSSLDPLLSGLRQRLYRTTQTSDQPAGTLSRKWAEKLGLQENVIIGTGAFDAHMGAVGGEIEPYYLSKVMGTSTCDMLVAPYEDMEDKLIHGICGQVDGSVIPGMIGLEAGQSAFGDVYAWYSDLLQWPVKNGLEAIDFLNPSQKRQLKKKLGENTLNNLSEAASRIEITENDEVALDWLNGRRTPDANQKLKTIIEGIDLSSTAPKLFKSLVESTCFGAKAIVDRFENEGIPIKGILGLGGVAKKSPYIMQTLADVLDMPIKIVKSDETCALGAAMFAATASGLFDSIEQAKKAMGSGFETTYYPEKERVEIYNKLYERYQSLGKTAESRIR